MGKLILTIADMAWATWLEVIETAEFALDAVFGESGRPQG
jgi:hypothetical protein